MSWVKEEEAEKDGEEESVYFERVMHIRESCWLMCMSIRRVRDVI